MYIEYWSREEIGEYCENPNLIIAKANELRGRIIRDLFFQACRKISTMSKQLFRQLFQTLRRISLMLKQLVRQPV